MSDNTESSNRLEDAQDAMTGYTSQLDEVEKQINALGVDKEQLQEIMNKANRLEALKNALGLHMLEAGKRQEYWVNLYADQNGGRRITVHSDAETAMQALHGPQADSENLIPLRGVIRLCEVRSGESVVDKDANPVQESAETTEH